LWHVKNYTEIHGSGLGALTPCHDGRVIIAANPTSKMLAAVTAAMHSRT